MALKLEYLLGSLGKISHPWQLTIVGDRGEPFSLIHAAPMPVHRWRRRIESGWARSITDLAEQEGVTV